jgi:hypothetical protein
VQHRRVQIRPLRPRPGLPSPSRRRHPGPPLAFPGRHLLPRAPPPPPGCTREPTAARRMREGKRSTAAGCAPLRDGVVCIRLVFLDAPRQAAGDSLTRPRVSPPLALGSYCTYVRPQMRAPLRLSRSRATPLDLCSTFRADRRISARTRAIPPFFYGLFCA